MTPLLEARLEPLAAALRALPAATAGAYSEGERLLVLARKRDRLELRLQMTIRSSTDGKPLLDALVTVPADAGLAPTARAVGAGQDFTRREAQYLDAMLGWAARVLSAPAPALKKRSAASPARKAVRRLVEAATDGSAAAARRFLADQGETLDELSDPEAAQVAIDFLRDADALVQLDWRDAEDLAVLVAERAERLGLAAVARQLREAAPGPSLQAQTDAVARILRTVDYALTEIDEGSDTYCFVVCAAARARVVIDALLVLGVAAKPAGAAEAEAD